MIRPELRATVLSVRLAVTAYELGLHNGIEWNFIDCQSERTYFFEGLGYERSHLAVHDEYGLSQVMRLHLQDRERLASVNSPFRRSLEKWTRTHGASGLSHGGYYSEKEVAK